MINLLRLFRRREHIDDTATAYIEGRATAAELAELEARAESEPGLMRDLDTVRQTVSLLRSVQPARAPRSFALTAAPVPVRRAARPRLAMAPAIFAIVFAAAIGLLAVGNIADVVRQSGDGAGSSEDIRRESSQAGLPEAGQSEPDASTQSLSAGQGSRVPGDSGSTAATAESSFLEDSTTAPAPPVVGGDTAIITGTPLAFDTTEPGDAAGLLPPPSLQESRSSEGEAGSNAGGLAPGKAEPTAVARPDLTPTLLPLATAEAPGERTAPPAEIDRADEAASSAFAAEQIANNNDEGIALPVWQLQVLFAVIAALMAAAWLAIRRRQQAG